MSKVDPGDLFILVIPVKIIETRHKRFGGDAMADRQIRLQKRRKVICAANQFTVKRIEHVAV